MQPIIIAALVAVLGVFGTSGQAKVRGREVFRLYRAGLRATSLVPAGLLGAVAWALVTAEAVAALGALAAIGALLAGAGHAGTDAGVLLLFAFALTAVLAAGVAVSLRRRTAAPCVCFGVSRPLRGLHLVRNLLLLAVVATGAGAAFVAGPTGGERHLGADAVGALAGAIVSMLFVYADDLADLFGPAPVASARPGPGTR